MTDTLEQLIGQRLMWGFPGLEPTHAILERIAAQQVSGVTLFSDLNTHDAAQVRALTAALQAAARGSGQPPLLIGTDQEGGQLMAVGRGTTHFPGNLALGATDSSELAYEVGHALGRELAAMGVNVNYAPVCDVNTNPQNPVVGTRSFGEEPALVGRLAAAMVEGLQAAGVAATAKHFPGHGDTATDSHYGTPILPHGEARLEQVEWSPFGAAIEAGTRLVMTAHVALPEVDAVPNLPATLSRYLMSHVLREKLGFEGVIISDAMGMGAIDNWFVDMMAAVLAGVDLLLLDGDAERQATVYQNLLHAARRGIFEKTELAASARRIQNLKSWVAAQAQPAFEVVGCVEHQALARRVARESVTLVKDDAALLPLRLPAEARVAVITPLPADLTPADTSSRFVCGLADAVRRYHPSVTDYIVSHHPTESEIAAVREQALECDLILVGTLNAFAQPEQAALVHVLVETEVPLIAIAMRMPYDLQAFPNVQTYLCTYSLHEPSMEAAAQALWGEIPIRGRLPTSIPGLFSVGHGPLTDPP